MDFEPAPAALHFELHLALRLAAEGVLPTWQADLLEPAAAGRLHFESLPALIRYLVRLESIAPPRGIR